MFLNTAPTASEYKEALKQEARTLLQNGINHRIKQGRSNYFWLCSRLHPARDKTEIGTKPDCVVPRFRLCVRLFVIYSDSLDRDMGRKAAASLVEPMDAI